MTKRKGFTLLELLIVIAILAILAAILIIVLNPAESLAQSRDTQRISDLTTLKTALGLFMTVDKKPQLDGTTGTKNDKCVGGGGTVTIWISDSGVTDVTLAGGVFAARVKPTTDAAAVATDGTGWIPIDLTSVTGGSPISIMPIDPVNDIEGTSTLAAVTNEHLMYRYACKKSPLGFEINTRLESVKYGEAGDDDKGATDGGDNSKLYEVGTALNILPATDDF